MRLSAFAVIFALGTLAGCSSVKEATGDYVVEAVSEKVTADVNKILDQRGLSLSQITSATDQNNDGKLDRTEIIESVKETTRDYVLLEAKNYIENTIEENKREAATKTDIEATKTHILNWILGLIAAYLGKQIVSAKRDGKRDERIAILEKLLNKDIDGDGSIGAVNTSDSNGGNPLVETK